MHINYFKSTRPALKISPIKKKKRKEMKTQSTYWNILLPTVSYFIERNEFCLARFRSHSLMSLAAFVLSVCQCVNVYIINKLYRVVKLYAIFVNEQTHTHTHTHLVLKDGSFPIIIDRIDLFLHSCCRRRRCRRRRLTFVWFFFFPHFRHRFHAKQNSASRIKLN